MEQVAKGQAQALWGSASPSLQAEFGSPQALLGFTQKVNRDFGAEVRVMTEGLTTHGAQTVYRRTSTYSGWARGVEVELTFEGDRLVSFVGRAASKEAPTVNARYKAKTPLRLPFDGTWYVLWGGRTWEDNRHAAVSDQRFAYDLLQLKGPSTFEGDGTKNEQYGCWGQTVVAPGDGVVVTAADGVPDNLPNQPRAGNLYGNHVVIDHGNGEYSLLGHLQQGSVKVKVGQTVHAGEVLARTGNSGMSTEPHLHYQLMDNADDVLAQGLPAPFQHFAVGQRLVESGEPRRGDLIAPAAWSSSSSAASR
jgi:hypothetical protein